MRQIVVAAALLLASACAQQSLAPQAASATGCARSATHVVLWSDAQTPDTIDVRANGPTCLQAVVTFVARNAHGDPLWTFISTYYDMATGGIAPENAPTVTPQQMDAFLAGWANVTQQTSGQLPEWREGASTITGPGGLTYNTSFNRETYEAIRQRNSAMICYAAAASATQCLVIDPASNAPVMIAAYGS